MVACWNWIRERDFSVQTHCNPSYRQSQCADNKNTHNHELALALARTRLASIAKSQSELVCRRAHQLIDNIVIAFLSFYNSHFPNRFNYLWLLFFPFFSLSLFLFGIVSFGWIRLLMTSENCLLFSHVRSTDTFFLSCMWVCEYVYVTKRWIGRELRLNHHNIQRS